jgi:hypothetical protein
MHELETEYENHKKSLQPPRVRSETSREKERIYSLAKYYAQKTLQHCEVCNKSYVFLERHYLSKKHLSRIENPLEVIKASFPEVVAEKLDESKKLIEILSDKKNELESELEESKKKITAFEAKEVKPLQLSELKRSSFRRII